MKTALAILIAMNLTMAAYAENKKILVVDDQELCRDTHEELLVEFFPNYQIVKAGNRTEAKAIFAASPDSFALVISDWHMLPDGGGTDLAEDIRSFNPSVPFLLLSGSIPNDLAGQRKFLEHLRHYGVSAILAKPPLPNLFRHTCAKLLMI